MSVFAVSLVAMPSSGGPWRGLERSSAFTPDAGWLRAATEEIGRAEYRFSPLGGDSWSAPNRAWNLRSRFGTEGAEIVPRDATAAGEVAATRVALSLSAFGREGALRQLPRAVPVASGDRVEYRYEGLSLVEWYINDERGIEQGFTLDEAPRSLSKGDDGPLVFEMAFSPDVEARTEADGASVLFSSRERRPFLRYGKLETRDAAGRLLRSSLELRSSLDLRPGCLRILVEDQDAIYPIVVDPLLTSAGWTYESDLPTASLGFSVASAGDLDNNLYDDVVIGAPFYDGGETDEGKVFVFYNGISGLPSTPSWSFESNDPGAQLGFSVAGAGRVNNDLYFDLIVGAPFFTNGEVDEGRAFVFHGSLTGLPVPAAPSWTAEPNRANSRFGASVASVSTPLSVNGDIYSDVIVGAPAYEVGELDEGVAFIWFGSLAGLGPNGDHLNWDWKAEANQAGAELGTSVASAGDVNGGGRGDVIIGAPLFDTVPAALDNKGWAFLWYGEVGILPGGTGTPLTASWSVESNQNNSRFGQSVAGAGNLNVGTADIVIGAPLAANGQLDEGMIFVWYGGGLVGHTFSAAAPWSAQGNLQGAQLGASVASAGDVDADGFGDLLAGAPFFDTAPGDDRGRAFLWRGSGGGLGIPGDPNNAAWAVQGDAPGARLGRSVAAAGDLDHDGRGDVILGEDGFSNGQAGEGKALIFFGFQPPSYLEFGPRGSAWRVEATGAGYTSVKGLVTGEYLVSGSASVNMGGCGGCGRAFTFTSLNAVKDPNDLASSGQPAFRITTGSAAVDAHANPILFPDPNDLDLRLHSFKLDPNGATTDPVTLIGSDRFGLWLRIPDNLESSEGSDLDFPISIAVEQDLDFSTPFSASSGFWIGPKDYPFQVVPAGVLPLAVTRSAVGLFESAFVYAGKEQGDVAIDANGVLRTRCQRTGACLPEANDEIFSAASLWDLDHYSSNPPTPAESVTWPIIQPGGLRATLYRTGPGTYKPVFPAGTSLLIDTGSTIEFIDSEPQGGSLNGELSLTLDTGAIYRQTRLVEVEGGARVRLDVPVDCTGEQSHSASFSGGFMLPGGRVHLIGLTPILGWNDLSWGGDGDTPGDPFRGFYVAGLDPNSLTFYAPDSVALIDPVSPAESVQLNLLYRTTRNLGEGTYAGLNVTKKSGLPMTTGVDVACPGPDPNTGHSLSLNASKVRLYVRRSGVTGIADAGALASKPYPYMGYDLTLNRFGASFLDNVPEESGVRADQLVIPNESSIQFSFAFDSSVELEECGDFGDMGRLSNAGQEQTLAYWGADFRPWAVAFEPSDAECTAVLPSNCQEIDPDDVSYVHVDSSAPLDLEPRDPNRPRFEDEVPMDFAPRPTGPLACNAIEPAAGSGTVRNTFEPGLGFETDLTSAQLLPLDPNDPAAGGASGDPNARYHVGSEFHLPFYGAGRVATVVRRGAADVLGAFDDPGALKVHVSRRVIADLFDLDLDLRYLPPDVDANIPARFMGGKGSLDLKFMRVPTSVKLLGEDPLAAVDPNLVPNIEHPEMYLGYLSDLASFTEVKGMDVDLDCDATCRSVLQDLGGFGSSADVDDMLPSIQAGYARLRSTFPSVNLRSMIGSAMQDTMGSVLPADIARAAGRVKGVVDGVREGFEAFKTLNLTGPGTFSRIADEPEVQDFILDHIQLDTDVDVLEFLSFKGFAEFNRHTANAEGDEEDTASVTIGAHDVDLGWAIAGVRAETILGTFRFETSPVFNVWGFDGEITLRDIGFGDVQFDLLGMRLGMGNRDPGQDYYYVAGQARGSYKSVTAEAGFFLGKSIDTEPLVWVDPDVGEVLEGMDSLTGIYARAEASFPILSSPNCFPYNLTGGGGAAFWLFSEGPTFGTKLRAYAHGTLACLVSARADLTLLGGLTGDVWHLAGNGFIAGGVGSCEPEDWDSRRDVLNDDWCLACVLSGEFRTDSRSREFDGDLRGPDCD